MATYIKPIPTLSERITEMFAMIAQDNGIYFSVLHLQLDFFY